MRASILTSFCGLSMGLMLASCSPSEEPSSGFRSDWHTQADRPWAGPDFWANRLPDWELAGGRLQTTPAAEGRPMRTLHLVTRRMTPTPGTLRMQVEAGWVGDAPDDAASVGFLVGAGRSLDYRAAALIHHSAGPGAGYHAGITASGTLFFVDLEAGPGTLMTTSLPERPGSGFVLNLRADPSGDSTLVTLHLGESEEPGIRVMVLSERLAGNLALTAGPDRAWFSGWAVEGDALARHDDRRAGPVLSAQHTLSNGVMTMTAQLMPLGSGDNQTVRLETLSGATWREIASAPIIVPGYTATFRVEDWDDARDTPYRVAYDLAGEPTRTYAWEGTVRRDPVDRNVVSVAGFTGNHNTARGVEAGRFDWNTHVWFPHTDVVAHVAAHDPDVLFFSGDQVYEGGSPTFPDRENAYLDYLYKWYLWCWAFRDITRDRPTVTIPDDHDVYQGNIWGQGGRATDKDDKGGYEMPADWVKMVERTQTSNLPATPDPTPIDQGIGVYFTDMTYGRIGMAVLEDRKFKHGPAGLVPGHEGRADHFNDPNFDPAIVERPDLELLGDRQLTFLRSWAADWTGQDMKLALSQTVFANMATHHGPNLMRLFADLDSNGWPKRGRDEALDVLRRGFAFMLQGDQHLSTIVHHGIDTPNDAGYSFCVPSIANFYPRAWMPESTGANRPAGAAPLFGEHRDAFGNYVTVYGVTNPTALTGVSTGVEPLELHDKMPGYGIVRFDKAARTITMENWPRYADPNDPTTGSQYEGWPKTIGMEENYGREAVAYLPTIEVEGISNPVVQIVESATSEIVYTLRIGGGTFRPKVFSPGTYTVRVGSGETGGPGFQTFENVATLAPDETETLRVTF